MIKAAQKGVINGQSCSKGCDQESKLLKRVRSTVKAAQKGVVSSQSALRNTFNAGRSVKWLDSYARRQSAVVQVRSR